MKYLSSAFSLQMLPEGEHNYRIRGLTEGEFKFQALSHSYEGYADCPGWGVCAIGHEGTAKALTKVLGFPVPVNRTSITLHLDDVLLVAQPTGKRIAYGEEIDFPELNFFMVEFHTCQHPHWEKVVEQVDTRVLIPHLAEQGLTVSPIEGGVLIGRPGQQVELYF